MFALLIFAIAAVPAALCIIEDVGNIRVYEERGLI